MQLRQALCLLGAAMFAEACTLDHRVLSRASDAGLTDVDTDSGLSTPGSGVEIADSATIVYGRDATSVMPQHPVVLADTGPCVHTDEQGNLDCSRTLVANADFNGDISDWNAESGALLRWVDVDVQGAKNSGAIAVKNAEKADFDGTVGVDAAQCLDATPGVTYSYAASLFIAHGQPFGEGQIMIFLYDSPACEGLVDGAYPLTQVDSTETWIRGTGSLIMPAVVRSMGVRLHVEKPFRNAPLEVLFDAVRVTAGPLPPAATTLP